MKMIYLHGSLKELHPEPINVHSTTAAEALTVLKQFPGFDAENPVDVRVDGFDCRDALFVQTDKTELHVYPALRGAGGNGGFLQILIGAVMVVVGTVLWWNGPIGGTMAQVGIGMMMGGAMMMLGGVISMLAPQPKLGTGSATNSSLIIPASQNTVKIGTRLPLLFGRVKHFGHYLSFNVDAKRYDDSNMVLGGYCNQNGDGQALHCVLA
ncbi:hypothetical protein GQ56_0101185 [Burkholderia paludis]|uniref:hypothetical protein n=1 Tax=Burkholderia paludis TaxID=1506587 RepID=UPI0004DB6CC9|nr:hypothetical protein [Burkholderia paludis]KFG99096.1 hypothetical protein GQ56_0101185 [Burkholderia paludis]